MTRRIERVNELIKQEAGKIIQKEIHCEGYLVTIISVNTSSDLKNALIKVSFLPNNKEKEGMLNLQNSAGFIQKILNRKLSMKFVPRISFVIDKGSKSAEEVDIILEKIKTKN